MAADLTEREFTLGDVSFTVRKLLAMEGYRILEYIRPALERLGRTEMSESTSIVQFYVALAAVLPPETVERTRRDLFALVMFTTPESPTPAVLAGQEEQAFKDLTPVHVYEVLARAFAVNFLESLDELRSRFPVFARVIPQFAPAT